MEQPEIPGVGPVEGPVWPPSEWITTTGKVAWVPRPVGGPCDDCLHCILDYLNSRTPAGTRPPGAARRAIWSRRQARKTHIFCEGHAVLRRDKETSHG